MLLSSVHSIATSRMLLSSVHSIATSRMLLSSVHSTMLLPFLLLLFINTSDTSSDHTKTTVIVYIDGFAHWFLDRNNLNLSGFDDLAKFGSAAEYLLPEFPTVPATNYWSIFTGRYPEQHGLIGDHLWSSKENRLLQFDTTTSFDNNLRHLNPTESVEPLWQTAINEQLPTSLYWWRPCPSEGNQGRQTLVKCTGYEGGDGPESIGDKIPEIMNDIEKEARRLILVYYPSVDIASRKHGPFTGFATEKILSISTFLADLQHELDSSRLWDRVNLVTISGNGISSVPIENCYFIDDFVDISLIDKLVGNGAYMWIYAEKAMEHKVYQSLRTNDIPHCRVEWRQNLPVRWHLKNATDAGNLLLICDQGYAIYSRNRERQVPRMPSELTEDYFRSGEHGYDSASSDMKGLFMGRGPDFLAGEQTKWIRAVDVYEKLCGLIDLNCYSTSLDHDSLPMAAAHTFQSNICPVILFMVLIFLIN